MSATQWLTNRYEGFPSETQCVEPVSLVHARLITFRGNSIDQWQMPAIPALGVQVVIMGRGWDTPSQAKTERSSVTLADSFRRLADKWRNETGMLSSISKKLSHPAYQAIIQMGEPVIPLILQELSDRPAYWFKALEVISKTNPIELQKVDLATARGAWLAWGKANGYIVK